MDIQSINKARVVHYGLFCSVLGFFENRDRYENIAGTIDLLSQNPIDENCEKAIEGMKEFLQKGGFEALKEENDMIFYSPITSFIPTTASFYDEQRDDGKMHLKMINYVLKSKFRRDISTCKEHEDHIEFILVFMQKLVEEDIDGDQDAAILARDVFKNVLNVMIDEFVENLYTHEKSNFYKNMAIVMKVFFELEREYLNISKPKVKESRKNENQKLTKKKEPAHERVKKNMDEVSSLVD